MLLDLNLSCGFVNQFSSAFVVRSCVSQEQKTRSKDEAKARETARAPLDMETLDEFQRVEAQLRTTTLSRSHEE